MKRIKRTLAALLTVVLTLALLGEAVFADNSEQPVWPEEGAIQLSKSAPLRNAGKSLAEFAARSRRIKLNQFLRQRIRRRKYRSVGQCANCPPLAGSSCAQQTANEGGGRHMAASAEI